MRTPAMIMGLSLAASAAAGCGRPDQDDPGPSPKAAAAAAGQKSRTIIPIDYPLTGVVKRVEADVNHVRIQHEKIDGFMDAMTMRFTYKDKPALERLHVGDHVRGTLHVEKLGDVVQAYELRDLQVTQPAAPAALAPNISKAAVGVRSLSKRTAIGEAVPDFTMTGQDGQSVKLSELRGKVIVLTFIYTRCPLPDFCPLMDKKFSELARRIDAFPDRALHIRLISLSFDPDHDTPELLRKHALARGAVPPLWSYAVASHAELAKIGTALGLFYQPGDQDIAHNLCTAIIGADRKLARLEVGTQGNHWESADFQKTIYSLLPGRTK